MRTDYLYVVGADASLPGDQKMDFASNPSGNDETRYSIRLGTPNMIFFVNKVGVSHNSRRTIGRLGCGLLQAQHGEFPSTTRRRSNCERQLYSKREYVGRYGIIRSFSRHLGSFGWKGEFILLEAKLEIFKICFSSMQTHSQIVQLSRAVAIFAAYEYQRPVWMWRRMNSVLFWKYHRRKTGGSKTLTTLGTTVDSARLIKRGNSM